MDHQKLLLSASNVMKTELKNAPIAPVLSSTDELKRAAYASVKCLVQKEANWVFGTPDVAANNWLHQVPIDDFIPPRYVHEKHDLSTAVVNSFWHRLSEGQIPETESCWEAGN